MIIAGGGEAAGAGFRGARCWPPGHGETSPEPWAAIDWCFELLARSEQALLAWLAVSPAGAPWRGRGGPRRGGIDPDTVFDLLAGLVAGQGARQERRCSPAPAPLLPSGWHLEEAANLNC